MAGRLNGVMYAGGGRVVEPGEVDVSPNMGRRAMPGEWERVSRVGTPDFKSAQPSAGSTTIRLKTWPRYPGHGWLNFFHKRASEREVRAAFNSSRDEITATAEHPDALAAVVEAIDSAIEYANDCYEKITLPQLQAKSTQQDRHVAEAEKSQADLDKIAESLARPDPRDQ
jgi:hypothetical protein